MKNKVLAGIMALTICIGSMMGSIISPAHAQEEKTKEEFRNGVIHEYLKEKGYEDMTGLRFYFPQGSLYNNMLGEENAPTVIVLETDGGVEFYTKTTVPLVEEDYSDSIVEKPILSKTEYTTSVTDKDGNLFPAGEYMFVTDNEVDVPADTSSDFLFSIDDVDGEKLGINLTKDGEVVTDKFVLNYMDPTVINGKTKYFTIAFHVDKEEVPEIEKVRAEYIKKIQNYKIPTGVEIDTDKYIDKISITEKEEEVKKVFNGFESDVLVKVKEVAKMLVEKDKTMKEEYKKHILSEIEKIKKVEDPAQFVSNTLLQKVKTEARIQIEKMELTKEHKDSYLSDLEGLKDVKAIEDHVSSALGQEKKDKETAHKLEMKKENIIKGIESLKELSENEKKEATDKIKVSKNDGDIDKIFKEYKEISDKRAEEKRILSEKKEDTIKKVDAMTYLDKEVKEKAKKDILSADNTTQVEEILKQAIKENLEAKEAKELAEEKAKTEKEIKEDKNLTPNQKHELQKQLNQAKNRNEVRVVSGETKKRSELVKAKEDLNKLIRIATGKLNDSKNPLEEKEFDELKALVEKAKKAVKDNDKTEIEKSTRDLLRALKLDKVPSTGDNKPYVVGGLAVAAVAIVAALVYIKKKDKQCRK